MNLTVFLLVSLIYVADASFWDGLPVISQLKSAVQAIAGDTEGAKRTQENFLDQAPIVSQVKSAVQAISGDENGARETQEKFLHNQLEPMADGLPVIGHAKGLYHIIDGEPERGREIIYSANGNTAAIVGGFFGGPAGAIGGLGASDAVSTGIESAVKKEYSPVGVVEYGTNIRHKSAGEHFDVILGLSLAALASKKANSGKYNVAGNEKNFVQKIKGT